MTQESELSFEASYARLEEILEKMNSGKVSLEESLGLYEEANRLITWSNKRLTEAEKKIEILVKNREGDLSLDEKGQPLTQEFVSANPSSPLNQTLT
jgi:exodeoxyribonuclease VII small subunit